eukprot:scaffold36439_cov208-Isochrysis_galbana.AAC.1
MASSSRSGCTIASPAPKMWRSVGLTSGGSRKPGTTTTKDSGADRTSVGGTPTSAVRIGQTSDAALDV